MGINIHDTALGERADEKVISQDNLLLREGMKLSFSSDL